MKEWPNFEEESIFKKFLDFYVGQIKLWNSVL